MNRPGPPLWPLVASVSAALLLLATEGAARADTEASFARPPPGAAVAVDDEPEPEPPPPSVKRRSSVAFDLGPRALTSGDAIGYGVGTGVAFGRGPLALRLAASFFRGEADREPSAKTGRTAAEYGAEVVVRPRVRGMFSPYIAPGLAYFTASGPNAHGDAGVGTLRAGVDVLLDVDDIDARVGASVGGALVGPVASELDGLRGYGTAGAHLVIGF